MFVIDRVSEFKEVDAPKFQPRRVLMVSPEHFSIQYAINPFMKNQDGELNKIVLPVALAQWNSLKATYEKLGIPVDVISGQERLPDMVYAANQCFPFFNSEMGRIEILLGRMMSELRQPEIKHFKKFFESRGMRTHEIESTYLKFEGSGDAFIHPNGWVLGGWGPRTDKEIYNEISERFHLPVARLQLVHPYFYHLDTALCVLGPDEAIVQREAFSAHSLELIEKFFKKIYWCGLEENLKSFTANAHVPKEKTVIMQKGSTETVTALKNAGYKIFEVETGEFIKAGGSVFCLKTMY